MTFDTATEERYYRLNGVVFRVRPDRPDQGARYLRGGAWVWTPITSAAVQNDPFAVELTPDEATEYRSIQ